MSRIAPDQTLTARPSPIVPRQGKQAQGSNSNPYLWLAKDTPRMGIGIWLGAPGARRCNMFTQQASGNPIVRKIRPNTPSPPR
jgi:hypothetical protein